MFSIITGPTVSRLIYDDVDGCMAVVRDAYLAHARGNTVNPSSVFLRFPATPNARIIALPSHLAEPWNVSGIKWIASYPDNIRSGTPRASAVLVLNSAANGYPFACMEASVISAARTAASAVLAADLLAAPERRRSLAIVGAGFISRHIYRFLSATGWRFERVRIHDTNPAAAERLAGEIRAATPHPSTTAAPDLASAIGDADLVVFATVSSKPHVLDRTLFDHRPVVLHVSLRDLSPDVILDAINVVDDVDHVMQADTSPHLAERQCGNRAFVAGTLADVIEGRCPIDRGRTVVFSPFGLGILDLAVGQWVHDRAARDGGLIPIPGFFGDADPDAAGRQAT